LRGRNKGLIVLGIAHLLFAHWLARNGITPASDEPRGIYPLWLSFIERHPFARRIAPTRLAGYGKIRVNEQFVEFSKVFRS
jgi:hypothetical protein